MNLSFPIIYTFVCHYAIWSIGVLTIVIRLGHASVSVTLDIYSHVLPGLQEAAAEKFDRIFDGDSGNNKDANVCK